MSPQSERANTGRADHPQPRTQSGRTARGVAERIIISGTLELTAPAHFGNGDVVGLTDMPLLRDPRDGQCPLLTGTSIAGALRNYLREYEAGYGARTAHLADRLFGVVSGNTSSQSWLMVDDALGTMPCGAELRDGVAINPQTRTAEDRKKYDIELLPSGTTFNVTFELLLTQDDKVCGELPGALAVALNGLAAGEIGLGQRKRRGFGACRVANWQVTRYDLTTAAGLVGWLSDDRSHEEPGSNIFVKLGVSAPSADQRQRFCINATFALPASILIRSGSGAADAPDMVHLRAKRGTGSRPVISGTSLAGALRARALRIANTVLDGAGASLVDAMFGKRIESAADEPTGSRVLIAESELEHTHDLVQSRVKIDRFTGGSFPTALFTEQPAFGSPDGTVQLHLELHQPEPAEIGLLLLVLKDLWTGDLPLGGESSVGRGRLLGQKATLASHEAGQDTIWTLSSGTGSGLSFGGTGTPEALEKYVAALWAMREAE